MSGSRLLRSASGHRRAIERDDFTPAASQRLSRGNSARMLVDRAELVGGGPRKEWNPVDRGNHINENLPADPEQARNFLSGAQRPATSYHNRAAGGHYTRVPDAWQATRGSQFRISSLEKAPPSCEKCAQLSKQLQAMKRKLSLLQVLNSLLISQRSLF